MTGGVLSVCLRGDEAGLQRAERSLERQGFSRDFRFAWDGGVVSAWSVAPPNAQAARSVEIEGAVACFVGVLWYRGRFGVAAAELLLREATAGLENGASAPRIDEACLRGNFALFLHARGRSWLINDALGFVRIYGSADARFHCTSWLAARAYSGDGEVDEAAAIEYVLLGAVHSDRTVSRGVGKLAIGAGQDLDARRAWDRFPGGMVPPSGGPGETAALEDCAAELSDQLRMRFREIAAAFPGHTSAALSGGFDSRLILAGLLAEGERPRLFVYGGPDSEDVPIAREIADAEGIGIQVVDKSILDRELPEPDLDELVRSALFFDGLPNDGIHDAGADRRTRLEQSAGGHLVLNGGGGEIFRNFFHLPDRGFRSLDIVRSFYRGFDSGAFRRLSGLADYERGLAESIERSLGQGGRAGATLTRQQVELVYPFFRCHHWMGLNNSLSIRQGHFTTPLIDLGLVRLAARAPLRLKNAGLLESRLISALHPGVAAHRSAYGFRFSDGPDPRACRQEWLACSRPVFARPWIGALRRLLQRDRVDPLLVRRCRALLPGEWRLDAALDLTRLPRDGAFERALSVEVVSRCL